MNAMLIAAASPALASAPLSACTVDTGGVIGAVTD